jgi:hypothetical protein
MNAAERNASDGHDHTAAALRHRVSRLAPLQTMGASSSS